MVNFPMAFATTTLWIFQIQLYTLSTIPKGHNVVLEIFHDPIIYTPLQQPPPPFWLQCCFGNFSKYYLIIYLLHFSTKTSWGDSNPHPQDYWQATSTTRPGSHGLWWENFTIKLSFTIYLEKFPCCCGNSSK